MSAAASAAAAGARGDAPPPPGRTDTTATAAGAVVRVATWNIHDAVGGDGHRDIDRVGRVIAALNAPIIGLQEVACGPTSCCDVAGLAGATGLNWRALRTHGQTDVYRGNALLTSLPIVGVRHHDLSIPGREPRAALQVDVLHGAKRLRVVVTHLGLRAGERRRQVARLLTVVGEDAGAGADAPDVTLLLGDINEWFMWGRPLRWLHRHFGVHQAPRTFPARMPLLALDRIWAHPRGTLSSIGAVKTGEAHRASDHLPVVATLRLPD